MRAYVASMQAAYLLEVNKWAEALDELVRAKAIYQKIAGYRDQIEAVIYQEKIEQLETFMRLASSKMKQQRSAKEIDDAFEGVRRKLQSEVEASRKAAKQE